MAVGQGFGVLNYQSRRAASMPDNPNDRATIVSIFPDPIIERKATVYPGYFEIPAAPLNDYSILVVGPSSWWKDLGEDQTLLEIPTNSVVMAESVIKDYCNGLFGCNMNDKMPGLFYVPGKFNKTTIKSYVNPENGTTFQQLLDRAKMRQTGFFNEVVKLADAMWARSNGNPLAISRDARLAAEILGLKSKPWMSDIKHLEMSNCPACGNLINALFPVCSNCKAIINPEKAKELNIKFAQ